MEPTSTQPGSHPMGTTGTSSQSSPTSAAAPVAGSPAPGNSAAAPAGGVQGMLDTALASGKSAVESGKQWLTDSGLADQAQQLPQAAKDFGAKAMARINGLTTTQKAVGVGLLAAGIAFLATRGRRHDDGEYRHVPRRSPFANKQYGPASDDSYGRQSRRSWSSSRFGEGSSRVSSGSGYASSGHSTDFGRESMGTGRRRDQGPASGSRYDARTSGSQNPNNLDDLTSAF